MLDSPEPGEVPILTPFNPPLAPPTESRLESTVLHLERRGDFRSLVCFAEKWATQGELTAAARMATARAFVELRMMDKAWIRLRDAVETEQPKVEALALAARLFLMRGWPAKARGPLERALAEEPESEELNSLWALLDQAPIKPDPSVAEGRDPDDIDAWLPLAELYMAAGSFIKAQSILERLHRHHPEHQRVSDLLWVLDGDFTGDEGTLAELAARLGPGLSDLADMAELPEDTEHTESVTPETLRAHTEPLPTESGSAFPVLFRSAPSTTTSTDTGGLDDEPETTQRADLASLSHDDEAAEKIAPPPRNEPGDTQIMHVIHRVDGNGVTPARGPVHEGLDQYDSSFDLGAFRREMGMTFPASAPTSDFDQLEDEDEDLIIVTRTEREETEEVSTGLPQLDLDPPTSEVGEVSDALQAVPTPIPKGREVSGAAAPQTESERDEPPVQAARATVRTSPSSRRIAFSAASWWLLSFSVLVVLFVVLLVGAIGLHILSTWL